MEFPIFKLIILPIKAAKLVIQGFFDDHVEDNPVKYAKQRAEEDDQDHDRYGCQQIVSVHPPYPIDKAEYQSKQDRQKNSYPS